jgi:cytochrome oxidase assembly protein ShyY1
VSEGGRRLPLALREPAWLAGLAAVTAFAAVAVLLGSWQWVRGDTADRRDAAVAARWDLAPAEASAVLGGGVATRGREWTPVLLDGRYGPGTVLVRNRPLERRNGFLVVSPLVLDRAVAGRTTVWVVRGWSPAGDDGPRVGAPPPGGVSVAARVRVAEDPSGRTAPAGQAYRLAPRELAAALGPAGAPGGANGGPAVDAAAAAVDGYAVLAAGQAGGEGLTPLPRPARDPGPHVAYALQWWAFALAGFVGWLLFYRRAARGSAPGDAGPGSDAVGDPWTYRPGPDHRPG